VLKTGVVISAKAGAKHRSQLYAEVYKGVSPVVSFGDRHVVTLITQGSGTVTISGRPQ
jgi:hypothetical protein